MRPLKDGIRSLVRIGYDGSVHKIFRGTDADKRFANEVRVLKYLEGRDCPFVPQVLDFHPEELRMVTTNCGKPVERLSAEKSQQLFDELESGYGVRHDDPFMRNITYSPVLNRFCVIDFELAEIVGEEAGDSDGAASADELDLELSAASVAQPRQVNAELLNSLALLTNDHAGSRRVERHSDALAGELDLDLGDAGVAEVVFDVLPDFEVFDQIRAVLLLPGVPARIPSAGDAQSKAVGMYLLTHYSDSSGDSDRTTEM